MNVDDQDTLQRFIFEKYDVRGAIIRLDASFNKAYEHGHYDAVMKKFLGQALCAVGLLSSTVKYKGRMTLQVQGDGLMRTLLAQSDESLNVRGLVQKKSEGIENIPSDFREAMGHGGLLISVDTEFSKERYQGVTELHGHSLASTLDHYFAQSDQLPTRLWLFANETHAAGLLLQSMPSKDRDPHFWEHVCTLANTVTEKELLNLTNIEILHRLFHQEEVRLHEAYPVSFRCSCTIEKMAAAVSQLGEEDAYALLSTHKTIEVTCDFCNRSYQFDKVDVANIFSTGNKVPPSDTTQ